MPDAEATPEADTFEWKRADAIALGSVLFTTCLAATAWLGGSAAVVVLVLSMQSSEWMFYVEQRADGSQVLWYKEPSDYVAMVRRGDVKGTMPGTLVCTGD